MANGRTETMGTKAPAKGGGAAPAAAGAKAAASAPKSDPRFETMSGIPLKAVYTAEDRPSPAEEAKRLGAPGEFPYTRALFPEGYRTKLWTMRQFAGFGSAEDTNQRFHYLLGEGGTGLSTAF